MYVDPLHISRNPHIHISTNSKKPRYYTYGLLERNPRIIYSTNIKRPTLKETHKLYVYGFLERNPHTLYIWVSWKFALFEERIVEVFSEEDRNGGIVQHLISLFCRVDKRFFCDTSISQSKKCLSFRKSFFQMAFFLEKSLSFQKISARTYVGHLICVRGFPREMGGFYIGETRGVEIGVEHRDEEEVRTHLFWECVRM